ncbi:MAG TPA: bifunctional hydroxymethylpyrimidine kinase/phosphomethylpyrimidine kinase [Acidimicrobiales bacterium]|nr:bifunctional hydroxymethylpyrimidine kinase/phosphomethylpyrimidine kinase [Acidimicrobiales bacterium]
MKSEDLDPPVALTIAGTDSGGAAGVAADIEAFTAHGVFGAMVVTAVTAQDTTGVHAALSLPPELVGAQLDAVTGDLPVAAVKTGMLANLAIVEVVTKAARAGRLPSLVVDPVMVASSGARLLEGDAVAAYRELLRHALVTTPNLPEAAMLLGREIKDLEAMVEAARELHALGAGYVVVKGGHLPEALGADPQVGTGPPDGERGLEAVDAVFDGKSVTLLRSPWTETRNVHGSGCTLSAAIAARLARGENPLAAIAGAKQYVSGAIARSAAWTLGRGPGPLCRLPLPDHLSTPIDFGAP